MKLPAYLISAFITSLLLSSCSIFESDEDPQEGPCSNWAQDSTVVANIMELNGQEKGYTGNISNCTEGRLTHWFPLSDFIQIDTLPPSIGQLSELKKLELQQNKLRSLPLEIGSLKKLTYLDLSNNQLQNLPATIGDLENLSSLFASINKLTILPKEIGNLKNLQALHASVNSLDSIPKEIGNLKNLKRLKLQSNQLQKIPNELAKLLQKFSTFIDFSENKICSFSPQIQTWIDSQNVNILAQKCDSN